MKVLFFLHKIGPYHHARFNELAKSFQITVVEILSASKEYDWENIKNIIDYKVIKISAHLKGKELKGKKLINTIDSIIQRQQPDAVITMGWNNRSYSAAVLIAKKLGLITCTLSDSTYISKRRYFFIEYLKKKLISCYDAYLVAGKRSENYLKKLDINNGIFSPMDVVDNNHFKENIVNKALNSLPPKYVLCVSRLIKEKNLNTLIDAFEAFIKHHPHNDLKLVIVGSGYLENQLRVQIKQLQLESVIVLHPFVQYSELTLFYKNALALILPSLSEQWGLVVNEAMASGLPVLVSKCCGCVDDLVYDGINGWIIEPTQQGIINGLEKLMLQSESERIKMGQASQKIIDNYDLKDFRIATLSMLDYAHDHFKKLKLIQQLMLFLHIYFS